MNNYKDIELIQNFRSGLLNEEEIISFNDRLKTDSAFKELYDDFFESEKLLQLKELWAVKEELDKLDYSIEEDGSGSSGKLWWGLPIVALIGAGGIYFTNLKETPKTTGTEIISEVSESSVITESNELPLKENTVVQKIQKKASTPVLPVVKEEDKVVYIPDTSMVSEVKVVEEQPKVVEEEIVVAKAELKCDENPKVDIVTKGSCENENNGVVSIKNIKGSYAPYRVLADDGINQQAKNEYNGLKPGQYVFYVVDSRECKSEVTATVEKLECVKEEVAPPKSASNYIIYLPGQIWKAPMVNKRGTLEILDQKGNVIFNQLILKDESDEWAGLDKNSREVDPGVYFYVLREEGVKDKTGTITVFK